MTRMFSISDNPVHGFNSQPHSKHGTYTLTTVLGLWLHELEERYGQRNMEYTILGIEFGGAVPHVWYPGGRDRKHVAIRLADVARENIAEALFELAHETVHLLNPTDNATVIEEGLAVDFSHEKSYGVDGHDKFAHQKDYLYCEAKLKELLSISPDAIMRLRKIQPSLSALTPAMIRSLDSRISADLAECLCKPKNDLSLDDDS